MHPHNLLITFIFYLSVSSFSVAENETWTNSNGTSSIVTGLISSTAVPQSRPLPNENICSGNITSIHRDPNDCDKYYVSCLVTNFVDTSTTDPTGNETMTNATQSRRCNENLLFDQIELKCLPSVNVDCNPMQCPESSSIQLLQDTMRSSFFIECKDGIAQRRECQPFGTVFDNGSQTCVKPQGAPEPLSISLLRKLIRFMKLTRDIMSPWMEIVKVNSTVPIVNALNISYDDDIYEDVIDEPPTLTNDSYKYVDDQMEVFTQSTKYIVLYYVVIIGIAFIFIFSFLVISAILANLFVRKGQQNKVQQDEEFYRYNQNDKYLMTRL